MELKFLVSSLTSYFQLHEGNVYIYTYIYINKKKELHIYGYMKKLSAKHFRIFEKSVDTVTIVYVLR